MSVINDKDSKYIVVAAGPGSGKTRILVHKLASLLLMEDVKHEQLLMVTFSRVAATEFKKRLLKLIGNAANFIEIKTFHSYCFDLLGKVGTIEKSGEIIKEAIKRIRGGEVEAGRITKTVLVIDEAKHQLYVAMTRAKRSLTIHYNGDYLQTIKAENLTKLNDPGEYLPPGQIAMQLGHKDVWLDFFLANQRLVSQLNSGDELAIEGAYCLNSEGKRILRFSQNFMSQIDNMKQKNYVPKIARIRFIVYWQKEDTDHEIKIVLARIVFCESICGY